MAPATPMASAYDTPFAPKRFAKMPSITDLLGRQRYKQHSPEQSPVAPGYKLSEKHQKVPLDHMSYKPMQDFIERKMIEEIRNTEPGKRRDYLMKKYESWVANGRPTYGMPGKNANKNEWVKTNKDSPIWMDEVEGMDPKHRKRIDLRDVYPEVEG